MDTTLPPWLDREAFPFHPRQVSLENGESLSVVDEGQGPIVLFSHGTPTWSYEWRAAIKALRGRYRCVAPDHLGFGLSPRPDAADYRPEGHARRFARLIDVLGLERYHLVVHDFGGPFALDSALARPERVASVTALNTFAWSFGDSLQTRAMAWLAGTPLFRWAYGALNLSFRIARSAWGDRATLTPATFSPYLPVFADPASRRRVLWALARSMRGSARFCGGLWDRRAALRRVPMHFIWGMRDGAFPPKALARFVAAFPQASVLELASAGHWPHEEQAEACVASLARFLDGLRTQETRVSS